MGGTKRVESNQPANGLFVCSKHHRLIEDDRDLAEVMGWLVPQHQPPADVPVMYRGAWVYLDDLGNLQRLKEVV